MTAVPKIPSAMTVAEFLDWTPPPPFRWQLVDGEPRAMVPANRTHGAIQSELCRLIANHLADTASACSIVTTPGIVPRVQSDKNFRIPDLAVTCAGYETEERDLTEPILVIEILSPIHQAETWTNVWAYTSIPSVQEILVLATAAIAAHVLRRDSQGAWPSRPLVIEQGDLTLASIGFRAPVSAAYRTSRLAVKE